MNEGEEDYLLISGLQHFAFCRRQWALIYLEQQWAENERTAEGEIMHKRVHDPSASEMRTDTLQIRGLRVRSDKLHVTGTCDVVEFHRDDRGVSLAGHRGKWIPLPIEYKRGHPKLDHSDELQLCAQAMCLEEMLCCMIRSGCLYYGETHRREAVEFTGLLRDEVTQDLQEMNRLYQQGYTPKAKKTAACHNCSMKDTCLPELERAPSARWYIKRRLEDP